MTRIVHLISQINHVEVDSENPQKTDTEFTADSVQMSHKSVGMFHFFTCTLCKNHQDTGIIYILGCLVVQIVLEFKMVHENSKNIR